jgi:hypothetical protein
VEPGNGRDHHAGLSGLLDQLDLPLGTAAPPALVAGDEFNAPNELGHRRMPALEPRSSGTPTVPSERGAFHVLILLGIAPSPADAPGIRTCSPVTETRHGQLEISELG